MDRGSEECRAKALVGGCCSEPVIPHCAGTTVGATRTDALHSPAANRTELIPPIALSVDLPQIRYSTAYGLGGVTVRYCLKSCDFGSSHEHRCLECVQRPT
jgi:hypothetical protein